VIESAAPPLKTTAESSNVRSPKKKQKEGVQPLAPAEPEFKVQEAAPVAVPISPEKAKTTGAIAPPAPVPQVFAPRVSSFRDANQNSAPPALNARFSFDYQVTDDRKLRVLPSAMGFLSASASSGTSSTSLADNLSVRPGMPMDFAIPAEAALITLVFSAQPIPRDATQPNIAGSLDPPSGTKTDPNPSPASRLSAIIQIRPAGVR
jgi:hypothetical protein